MIAAMTVGKDVAMLFPDVVNCMQTDDLELKKLVYLYLINYAKTQPDLAIMAVNTFVKARGAPLRGGEGCTRTTCLAPALILLCVSFFLALFSKICAQVCSHLCLCVVRDLAVAQPFWCAAGLARSKPADSRTGGAHNGVHPRGQNHGVPLRPAAALPEGARRC